MRGGGVERSRGHRRRHLGEEPLCVYPFQVMHSVYPFLPLAPNSQPRTRHHKHSTPKHETRTPNAKQKRGKKLKNAKIVTRTLQRLEQGARERGRASSAVSLMRSAPTSGVSFLRHYRIWHTYDNQGQILASLVRYQSLFFLK